MKNKDCKTVETFNVKGKTKPRFCAKHKEIGMVSLETVVHSYLDEHIKMKSTLLDKKIDDGCSGKRPDRLYDMVEVDEYQHSGYSKDGSNSTRLWITVDFFAI